MWPLKHIHLQAQGREHVSQAPLPLPPSILMPTPGDTHISKHSQRLPAGEEEQRAACALHTPAWGLLHVG